MNQDPLVVVKCLVYNHEAYIRETLEGFVNQVTNFKFVAIVHDDASKDNSADIIKEYADKYPDIIVPIFETENQYSKGNGILSRIMNDACLKVNPKYIAMCEGDDYWIDPYKLQKQVSFLESNPEYSLCVTNVLVQRGDNLYSSDNNVTTSQTVGIQDIILNGGLYLASTSIVYRFDKYKSIPDIARTLHVGDYPLQIYLAYVGKVWILNDVTAVYRIGSLGSWTNRIQALKNDPNVVKDIIRKELYLIDVMDNITENRYANWFQQRKVLYLFQMQGQYDKIEALKTFMKHPIILIKHLSYRVILSSLMPNCIKQKVKAIIALHTI